MTSEQYFKACVNAPPGVRAKIEMLLSGDDSIAPRADDDARTCSKAEAARRLNVSRQTVYAMIRRCELEIIIVNGSERVPMRSVKAVARGVNGMPPASNAAAALHARRVNAGRAGGIARARTLQARRMQAADANGKGVTR